MVTFWDKLRSIFGDQVLIEEDTQLEQYCRKHFTVIPKIAYKQKRSFNTAPISLYLNELITPRSFEVDKLYHGVYPKGTNTERAKSIGTRVSSSLVWEADKDFAGSEDYYLYPNEALVNVYCDCEDHAFVVASSDRELGVAYGFYDQGGHAFNVFVDKGKLYVLDTVSNKSHIEEYTPSSLYKVHFIITPRYTFRVLSGVQFGEIAKW